ncbi:hypothetical protein BJ912DRAFT_1070210 [Pholiota molesta]|nr:hypothetical protein BJ912DRAFT_1070210 [Pholiota molesta]
MLLARDSTLYFTVIFALLLANYLVFQFAPPALAGLLVTPAATTGCILGSQMMIHMRTMAEHTGDTNNCHSHSIPVISTHEALRARRGQRRELEVGVPSLEFAEMHAMPSPTKDLFQVDSRPLTPPSNLEFASSQDDRRRSKVMFAL